jgi:hypothetical protein
MAVINEYANIIIIDDPIVEVNSSSTTTGTATIWIKYPVHYTPINSIKQETTVEKYNKKRPYYRKNERW